MQTSLPKQNDGTSIQDAIFLTQFSEEETHLLNDERSFNSSFGFSASYNVRKTILLTKNQLSMSIKDIKKLYIAGFIQLDPVGEIKASIALPRYKVILSALEILMFMLLYLWPAVLFSELTSAKSNLGQLALVITIGLLGFFLVYFQYQRNIQPIIILKKHGFSIGDHYVLPKP